MENGAKDAHGAGVAHPNSPSTVVFEGSAEDVATLRIFVHKRLHDDGDKRVYVVVVGAIDCPKH